DLLTRTADRASLISAYRDAYRLYCWAVTSVDDLRIAPFHVLAGSTSTYFDRSHDWHMKTAERLVSDPVIVATRWRTVDLDDADSTTSATSWWEELTEAGGEGMVVKPATFVSEGRRGLLQPAIKCRGREYLRIIYGPEYTLPENLARLRHRSLGLKRSLATREFALGAEGLERFLRGEGLYRVHECVFGVLALESEAVDASL
ncbi:MAG: putative phosphatase, partial [Acidimicrobiaceae bacterium]|nr:putative phosphatase [Acidimicrobiaceae bacterium]